MNINDRGLWEAYMQVVENQQLDEISTKLAGDVVNARIARTGAAADRAYKHRNPQAMRAAETAADKEARAKKLAAGVRKRRAAQQEQADLYDIIPSPLLDEAAPERITKPSKNPRLMKNAGPARVHNPQKVKEQVDIYDIILSHLLDEGYAETPEAAEAIMVNMGEEWRQSIVDEGYQEPRFGKKQYINKLSKRGGMGMGTPEDPHGYRDPKMAKVGAELSKRKTAAAKAKRTGGPDEYRAEKEAQSKKR
jgi:hypothetical protein